MKKLGKGMNKMNFYIHEVKNHQRKQQKIKIYGIKNLKTYMIAKKQRLNTLLISKDFKNGSTENMVKTGRSKKVMLENM